MQLVLFQEREEMQPTSVDKETLENATLLLTT